MHWKLLQPSEEKDYFRITRWLKEEEMGSCLLNLKITFTTLKSESELASQSAFIWSKLTIETLEQGLEYI